MILLTILNKDKKELTQKQKHPKTLPLNPKISPLLAGLISAIIMTPKGDTA